MVKSFELTREVGLLTEAGYGGSFFDQVALTKKRPDFFEAGNRQPTVG